MGKESLAGMVKEKAKLADKTQAMAAVDAIMGSIREELAAGNSVALKNFGTFVVVTRAGRTGKNPRTGESMAIPAKKVVRFTPGKELKEAAAASKHEWGGSHWLDYRSLVRTVEAPLKEIKAALARRGVGVEKLQARYDDTVSRLKDLSANGGQAFQEMRKGFSAAFAELREAFKKAADRF
ncbi:MAG: HU family DNA-binding protein [Thermodesulfobacteriota bacterium]